jgi:Zn-dependent peptidase ImmA (M78 family)
MSVESEEYLNFSNKINEYISAYMLGVDMNLKEYNFNYMWEEIISKGISVRPFPFERAARRSISGMIVKDDYEVTLAFNANMPAKRKNFTISHELTHFLYHLNNSNRIFTDTKETLNYSFADLLPEFQANIGASAILLPDAVFIRELKDGTNPAFISKTYGISENAIYIKLVQLMQANFEASFGAASTTANRIMRGNFPNIEKTLGNNLEKKLINSNPFYEALCI